MRKIKNQEKQKQSGGDMAQERGEEEERET